MIFDMVPRLRFTVKDVGKETGVLEFRAYTQVCPAISGLALCSAGMGCSCHLSASVQCHLNAEVEMQSTHGHWVVKRFSRTEISSHEAEKHQLVNRFDSTSPRQPYVRHLSLSREGLETDGNQCCQRNSAACSCAILSMLSCCTKVHGLTSVI